MQHDITEKNCILIVDDDFINRELLKNIFSLDYTFEEADNGKEGLAQIRRHKDKLCAIIFDVQMPKMTGIEVLKKISEEGITECIPTFLITAQDDDILVTEAYSLGVVDVVSKPVTPVVIQKRVKTVIELFAAREYQSAMIAGQEKKLLENAKAIDELNRSTIEALATAIEFRDIESGQHVSRIYGITKYILTSTSFGDGLSSDTIESIARGAIMHDVGKIAISDIILNKPGRLTKEEFEIMKQHTVKGYDLLLEICKTQLHESYQFAADIARHHHERWDGRGYPDGLAGDEISIASQVVSIADVYDALVSVRVYKKAFTPDEAVNMIKNGECGVFNPKLIECFLEAEPAIRKWYLGEETEESLASVAEDAERVNSLYSNAVDAAKNEPANSVIDFMLLMTAVQTAYDMIISVNLTKNTYHAINYENFGTHYADNVGAFDDFIEAGTASIPISHRKEFHDTLCRANLIREYRSGKRSVRLEHPQYTDDGKLHWVSTKVLFVEDSRSGDLLQITLVQYIDEEYAKKEQTRKVLSEALSLAERANTAKHDFLSKMSHDIRTPLNAIIGMSTIISSNLDDKDKIRDCLSKIDTSSKYLLGIITDILDYTKIENGSLSLSSSEFNILDLVTPLVSEADEQAKKKHQTFTVTVSDNVANSYIGDEYRINQVLTNLLDNAHRFTAEGGEYSLSVNIGRSTKEHDVLIFSVSDNGCGIRPEFLPRIFEPFAQDSGADTIYSIGLGLPIARNLAHLMNGDLFATSEYGKGSVFTLEVPMERGHGDGLAEVIDTDINVLVVDDEIAVCEQTSALLHNMGICASITDNGADAVKMVRENLGTANEFDVAIVDLRMSAMDGIETVRRIRREVGEQILVVIMSAYDWSEIEAEARAAGVDLFLAKPIAEANLRTVLACSAKLKSERQSLTFGGEKVLVAEDNEFNAEVAKAILEMKNLRVELVPNGKLACERFVASEQGEYLAILMDVLMPVMNGHEATRAIRSSTHPEAATIPIFAMTANAFRNDILEAKLAGMDGHISKPVNFDEVARILRSIVKNKQNSKINNGGGVIFMENYTKLTKAGVDVDELLKRLMGNESLVKVFIKKFTEDTTFEKLVSAFSDKDMKAAEMASHTLKGMCGNLSLTNLFGLFSEQVNFIRNGEYNEAEAMMPELTELYTEAIRYMNEFLSEI